ncbi:biosynthetic peptidoglycan transglycosylase, partial [Streptomyces sp. SID337]|uniref:biosynthetic peptidoglycan transglycosylase n=1 Tax=Streptomyces sp. SID337 TaxID=2690262 RepID=UPI0013687218
MSDEPQQQGKQGPVRRPRWASREPQDTPAETAEAEAATTAEAGATAENPQVADGAAAGAAPEGKKGKKPKRPKRKGWRRIFPTWRMVLGGFILIILLCVGGFMAGYMLVDIPAANSAATKQSNVYLYADGTQIARDGEVNREKVPLKEVPLHVQRAVLAAEDRDFYGESAVDPKAMIRAAWNTVTGKGKQSGSTITQQYVKNYYL